MVLSAMAACLDGGLCYELRFLSQVVAVLNLFFVLHCAVMVVSPAYFAHVTICLLSLEHMKHCCVNPSIEYSLPIHCKSEISLHIYFFAVRDPFLFLIERVITAES